MQGRANEASRLVYTPAAMLWKKESSSSPTDENCADALFHALADGLKAKDGRIRAEDLITAAASITGELCIEAAGNFNPRKHEFVPGSRVFSDRVNEVFSGDSATEGVEAIPDKSVVGILRDKLLARGYAKSDFPSLKIVFEHFAANIGKQSEWGKVPLLVPDENKPLILPLRVNYETRALVDRSFQPLTSTEERLRAASLALSKVLIAVQNAIDRKIALLLALQIVNGMSKTAPMTDEAMSAAKNRASK